MTDRIRSKLQCLAKGQACSRLMNERHPSPAAIRPRQASDFDLVRFSRQSSKLVSSTCQLGEEGDDEDGDGDGGGDNEDGNSELTTVNGWRRELTKING